MIHIVRTVSIMPGKNAKAAGFSHKSVEHVHAATGVMLQVMVPISGNPSRIAWQAQLANLADLEAFLGKLAADQTYLALVEEYADVFLPGSLTDEIWRMV